LGSFSRKYYKNEVINTKTQKDMNNVERIKAWISKEQDGLMDANGNFGYPERKGAYHILCNLDAYIDSLQEEPVSGKLKAAAEEYSFNVPTQCYADIGWKNETEKHFIDGANWQKAQLLAGDAIKEVKGSFGGEIKVDLYAKLDNGGYVDFDPSMKLNPACGVKIGNRVRIIVMED
jgi:hypothetical protein